MPMTLALCAGCPNIRPIYSAGLCGRCFTLADYRARDKLRWQECRLSPVHLDTHQRSHVELPDVLPLAPTGPTEAAPGSVERMAVYAARVALVSLCAQHCPSLHLSLFDPADARLGESAAVERFVKAMGMVG